MYSYSVMLSFSFALLVSQFWREIVPTLPKYPSLFSMFNYHTTVHIIYVIIHWSLIVLCGSLFMYLLHLNTSSVYVYLSVIHRNNLGFSSTFQVSIRTLFTCLITLYS